MLPVPLMRTLELKIDLGNLQLERKDGRRFPMGEEESGHLSYQLLDYPTAGSKHGWKHPKNVLKDYPGRGPQPFFADEPRNKHPKALVDLWSADTVAQKTDQSPGPTASFLRTATEKRYKGKKARARYHEVDFTVRLAALAYGRNSGRCSQYSWMVGLGGVPGGIEIQPVLTMSYTFTGWMEVA